jgi:biotin operon repressor
MLYRRSQEIEKRLADLIRHIRIGRFSTLTLAGVLRVSRPTVARCITALRERGYTIRAVRDADGWSYELVAEPAVNSEGTAYIP